MLLSLDTAASYIRPFHTNGQDAGIVGERTRALRAISRPKGDRLGTKVRGPALGLAIVERGALLASSRSYEQMTPDRVKSVREGLQLSQDALAQVLRLGPHGKRTVARWEAGDNPVPGPVSVALEALEAGWCPGNPHYRDMLAAYESLLADMEKTVLQAREHVRNTTSR